MSIKLKMSNNPVVVSPVYNNFRVRVPETSNSSGVEVAKASFPRILGQQDSDYFNSPLYARDFSEFCQQTRRKWASEEQNKISQVKGRDLTIRGIISDLYALHEVKSHKSDYTEALYEGIVRVIKDWIWRRSDFDYQPCNLSVASNITPWRPTERIEDRCTELIDKSINMICGLVKRKLHEVYLNRRSEGGSKWYMAGFPFEWLADKNGNLASEFVNDFINLTAEVIRLKRSEIL